VVVAPCLVVPGGGVAAVDACVTGPVCVVVGPLDPPPRPDRIRRTATVTASRKRPGAA
jgi:hypothetical protein